MFVPAAVSSVSVLLLRVTSKGKYKEGVREVSSLCMRAKESERG